MDKRLTERTKNGAVQFENRNGYIHTLYSGNDGDPVHALAWKLAELEDKIEQGTLIELPCKVGDIVYEVCKKPSTNSFVLLEKEFFIIEHKIGNIRISMVGNKPIFAILTLNRDLGVMSWSSDHINTCLFLTREEAEKKLKELQEKEK